MSNKKIVYIEDNPANLKLVEHIVKRLDSATLLSALEPVSGIELVKNELPALVLLDINLPGMSGFDVLKILKEDSATRDIPVVAVSANAMPSDEASGRQAGFNDYITKPIDIKKFLDTVDRYI